MTALAFFLSQYRLPLAGWVLFALYSLGLWLGLAWWFWSRAGGGEVERPWARRLASLACALFALETAAPLVPERIRGLRVWAAELSLAQAAALAAELAVLGALAFWLTRPPGPGSQARARAAKGAVAGAAAAVVGGYANAWLTLAQAAGAMGHELLSAALTLLLPAALALSAAWVIERAAHSAAKPAFLAAGALALAWALPAHAALAVLGPRWGVHERGLAEAAKLELGPVERRSVFLFEDDGTPMYSELDLAVDGLPASASNLRLALGYLNYNEFRSQHARAAVELLREGWLKRWDAERWRKALVLGAPNAPPELFLFARAMRAAPVTAENFELLKRGAARVDEFPPGQADAAQELYEELAGSFGHFGDSETALYWLGRVKKLYPLSKSSIAIPQIEHERGGRIVGKAAGLPSGSRVGLFRRIPPHEILVAHADPDDGGRFSFDSLTPEEYLLGVAGPLELRGYRVSRGGVVRVLGRAEPARAELTFTKESP